MIKSILIPIEKWKTFNDKAEKGVLIGYHGDIARYRILNPATNRVWISRSVRIIETNPKEQERSPETEKGRAASVPSARIKLPVTLLTQHVELEGPENQESDGMTDNKSDEQFLTPPPTPQVPQRRVSQRSTKSVPPPRLRYKVEADYVKEPINWKNMIR